MDAVQHVAIKGGLAGSLQAEVVEGGGAHDVTQAVQPASFSDGEGGRGGGVGGMGDTCGNSCSTCCSGATRGSNGVCGGGSGGC